MIIRNFNPFPTEYAMNRERPRHLTIQLPSSDRPNLSWTCSASLSRDRPVKKVFCPTVEEHLLRSKPVLEIPLGSSPYYRRLRMDPPPTGIRTH